MNAREARRVIESEEFRIRLNVASSLRSLLRPADDQPAVQNLLGAIRDTQEREALLAHVVALSRRPADPRYENNFDTALAVYVWLLTRVDSAMGMAAAQAVTQAPQCWWAPRVATEVLFGGALRTATKLQAATAEWAAVPAPQAMATAASTELYVSGFPMDPGPVRTLKVSYAVADRGGASEKPSQQAFAPLPEPPIAATSWDAWNSSTRNADLPGRAA